MSRTPVQHRHEKFARAYILDLNATNAAISAGYSEKTARQAGARLLSLVNIKARIAELQKKTADKLEITAERVLRELALLGYSNMQDYVNVNSDGQADVDLTGLSRDQFAAIQEISADTTGGTGDGERRQVLRTRLKLASKTANLELLGKHLKLFTEIHEHKGFEGLADQIAQFRKQKTAL